MNITKITGVYFSPTGSTAKVVRHIGSTLAELLNVPFQVHSYTLPREREKIFAFAEDELVIWGTPVYAGRIPNMMLNYVQNAIEGNGAPAIPIVTYGNRSYSNALAELHEILQRCGCLPIAAAAVVCRHPFSDSLAVGRPDSEDLNELTAFCRRIADKHKQASGFRGTPTIPGDPHPTAYYVPKKADGSPARFLKAAPVFDQDRCSGCGLCTRLCPMGSIEYTGGPGCTGICIKCQACVRRCPQQAIRFEDPDFLSHVRMLEENFRERKHNDFF